MTCTYLSLDLSENNQERKQKGDIGLCPTSLPLDAQMRLTLGRTPNGGEQAYPAGWELEENLASGDHILDSSGDITIWMGAPDGLPTASAIPPISTERASL